MSVISPRTNQETAADPGRPPGRRALRRRRRDLGRLLRSSMPWSAWTRAAGAARKTVTLDSQPGEAGVRRRGRVGQQPVDRDGHGDRRGHRDGHAADSAEPRRRGPGGRRRRGLGRQPARGDGVAGRPRAWRGDRHGPRLAATTGPVSVAVTPGRGLGGERVRRDAGTHRPGAGRGRRATQRRRPAAGRDRRGRRALAGRGRRRREPARRDREPGVQAQGSSGRRWTSRLPTGSRATSPTTGSSRTSARAASRRWLPTWPRPCRCRPTAAARMPSGCGAGSATLDRRAGPAQRRPLRHRAGDAQRRIRRPDLQRDPLGARRPPARVRPVPWDRGRRRGGHRRAST